MKTRTHAADYYRRILSAQPHALKRLDPFAAIVKCHRGQEISNDSGPAGHWYYVIVGAVRRCSIRSDGRRQIVDLMLPRDFFFVSDNRREETIEAIAEKTVLAIPADGLNVSRSVIRSSRVNCAIGSVSVPHAIPGTTPDPWWRHRA